MTLIALSAVYVAATAISVPCTPNCPVLMVGGLSGSVLEAKVSARTPRIFGCANDQDWYRIWANMEAILNNRCFSADMKLRYDNDTLRNASGVSIRPVPGLAGLEYISISPAVAYYHNMITELESSGWVRNQSIFGFSYDWRATGDPSTTVSQLTMLREAIEDASARNGGRPVHVLAHSLGVIVTQLLLNGDLATDAWKRRFVRSVAYLAPPLKGAAGVLQAAVLGPQLGKWIPQFVPNMVVPAVRTCPSIALLMPNDREFWKSMTDDRAFIVNSASNMSYGFDDMAQFLADLPGAAVMQQVYPAVSAPSSAARLSRDPGVPTLCAFANDTETALRMRFKKLDFEGQQILQTTPGDGTVNRESMAWCYRWADATVNEYVLKQGSGAHVAVASDKTVVKDVVSWWRTLS